MSRMKNKSNYNPSVIKCKLDETEIFIYFLHKHQGWHIFPVKRQIKNILVLRALGTIS